MSADIQGCLKLSYVSFIASEPHATIAAVLLLLWRKIMMEGKVSTVL